METIKTYFNLLRSNADFSRSRMEYDSWCETVEEQLQEVEYAIKNNVDPIFYCWNCKYGECDVHNRCVGCDDSYCKWCQKK